MKALHSKLEISYPGVEFDYLIQFTSRTEFGFAILADLHAIATKQITVILHAILEPMGQIAHIR